MIRQLSAYIALIPLSCLSAYAGNQQYEPLSDSVAALMQRSVADAATPRLAFEDEMDGEVWLADQLDWKKKVLVRFLPSLTTKDDDALERFHQRPLVG